jgi:hypothetical protein
MPGLNSAGNEKKGLQHIIRRNPFVFKSLTENPMEERCGSCNQYVAIADGRYH